MVSKSINENQDCIRTVWSLQDILYSYVGFGITYNPIVQPLCFSFSGRVSGDAFHDHFRKAYQVCILCTNLIVPSGINPMNNSVR